MASEGGGGVSGGFVRLAVEMRTKQAQNAGGRHSGARGPGDAGKGAGNVRKFATEERKTQDGRGQHFLNENF